MIILNLQRWALSPSSGSESLYVNMVDVLLMVWDPKSQSALWPVDETEANSVSELRDRHLLESTATSGPKQKASKSIWTAEENVLMWKKWEWNTANSSTRACALRRTCCIRVGFRFLRVFCDSPLRPSAFKARPSDWEDNLPCRWIPCLLSSIWAGDTLNKQPFLPSLPFSCVSADRRAPREPGTRLALQRQGRHLYHLHFQWL